jgi:hypothetical protein
MRTESWRRAVSLILIANFLLISCATLEDVQIPGPDQPAAAPPARVGDTVEVTTRDGEKKRFKGTAVESDALVGEDARVPYRDMFSLRVEHGTAGKSGKTIAILMRRRLGTHSIDLSPERNGARSVSKGALLVG